MSGILSSEKRTSYRILSEEFPENVLRDCLNRNDHFLPVDLETKLNQFNSLDKNLRDKAYRDGRKQFTPVRNYFQKGGIVYSIYNSLQSTSLSEKYAIFLMSNEDFAFAVANRGEIIKNMAYNGSLQAGNLKSSSRRAAEQIWMPISTMFKAWKDELYSAQIIYIHCPARHKEFLKITIKNARGLKLVNDDIQKIPFVVNEPTTEELSRVWQKLFSVVEHGSTQSFIKALETGQMNKIADNAEESEQSSHIESTKQQRRDEKQRWPGITPQKKIKLNEALISNHYERLQDLVEKNPEIIDYLSTTHEKLRGQTYMHYATKENLIESVEFLLNVGCDSSISDNTSKVPYEYAKTIEMKQTFVDFRKGNTKGRQWTKSRVPEKLKAPSPLKPSKLNENNADTTKLNGNTSKGKRKQKYVDMIDDDFDYDDYDYEEEEKVVKPAPPNKTKDIKWLEEEKEIENEEADTETKLKTHTLWGDDWRPTEFQLARPVWTDIPLKKVGTRKVDCQQLRKFLEERMQVPVRTYFSNLDTLYSGYSAILGGYFTLHNRAFKPHAVILINDEYFAGTAYDNGKVCCRKTLYRKSANWTKIRDFTKGNLVQNRFMDQQLSSCIRNVLNYWAAEVEIKVLYSCPPEFEWFLKEHILESFRYAKFECIPFNIESYTIPEVNRIWKKFTTLTEHGQHDTFNKALEEKDYETLENMLEDPTQIVLPLYKDPIVNEWISPARRKEMHKAIIKNNYKVMESVAGENYYLPEYLGRPHAKFGGLTFQEVATRENLNQTAKYLSDRWWYH